MSLNPTETAIPTGSAQPTDTAPMPPGSAPSTPQKAPGSQLTDEVLKEFVDGKRGIEQFTPAQAKEFHSRFASGKEELPDPTPKAPVLDPKPAAEASQVESKKKENVVPGEKYFQKATEANDYKQKFESAARKLAVQEELVRTMQTQQAAHKPNQDRFSEEYLAGLEAKVINLESTVQRTLTDSVERTKADKQMLEKINLFNELEGLQSRVPALKTSRPVRELDDAYAEFQRDIGGPEARQKFLDDPEFRKQKESEGYTFPISKDDFDKYAHIVGLNRFKAEGKYPTWSSAFADYQERSGFKAAQPEQTSSAAEQAAKKVVQKLAERADEPTLLPSTTSGSGVSSSSWTDEKAGAWMQAHPKPASREERAVQAEIHAFLRNKFM